MLFYPPNGDCRHSSCDVSSCDVSFFILAFVILAFAKIALVKIALVKAALKKLTFIFIVVLKTSVNALPVDRKIDPPKATLIIMLLFRFTLLIT